ncbi:MAG: zinc-binding dehydrogenase [Propionibacteriaceae bacterium]|nr:zinc-binding dehydrogenase [Actinomycetota bacterium]MCW5951184.1 zinc-binding dehydrogenase [Propionibacteriaceae bacterium]
MPRTARLHAFGGPQHIQIDNLPDLEPAPGEVRFQVKAAGLARDQFVFMAGDAFEGSDMPATTLPARFGGEGAGVVDAVGEGVDPAWLGKRVAPLCPFDEERYGMLAEQALAPVDLLAELPESITFEQAAGLWMPYLTAYGIVMRGKVNHNDTVVVSAASSAVALAAIEMAKDADATVIGVIRTPGKADAVRQAGADHVIVNGDEDFVTRVTEITHGAGATLTFDPIGGNFLARAAEAAARRGRIVEYGILAVEPGRYPQEYVIGKNLRIDGWTMSEIVTDPDTLVSVRDYILTRVADGRFRPRVARTFPLEQIQNAYAYIGSNQLIGRTIITPTS